jgi:hypothetical protein
MPGLRGLAQTLIRAWLEAVEPIRVRRVRHELAVCAIFREEAPFLDEWIRFHLGVGVEHFFLYNNFSTDAYAAVLAPWIERGVVTLKDWPVRVGQLPAYRHCLRRARASSRWVAFIDIDEFLFSPLMRDIRPILREHADVSGVTVWQVFFGSGGHDRRPEAPVTFSYLKCAGPGQTTVKTIANPRMVYKVGVHLTKFWGGKEAHDTQRRSIAQGLEPVLDKLRVNHYWSRSIEDLETKVARGDASTAYARRRDWHIAFEQTLNAESDEAIVPLARAILCGE